MAALDWSSIDPSILGTLFERGLDPGKRSQLGAHYTDRDKIMRIVDPVVVDPLAGGVEAAKARISTSLERANKAKSRGAATRHRKTAEHALGAFLERLRQFTVLDPACGSGNFLYLALHALHDVEHRAQLEAEAMGLQRAFPAVGPANVKGIEINAYAAELARVSVWIGEIQVDAAQRVPRLPPAHPRSIGNDRVPRCDSDAGGRGAGVARRGRDHRQPTVPRRQGCSSKIWARTTFRRCSTSIRTGCRARPIWSATGS